MLRLTANAVQMIHALTAEADLRGGGLRIAQEHEHPGLTMQLAREPRDEDDVLESDGAQLFLDRIAAGRLHGRTLDARTTDAGSAFFLDG